MNRDTAANPYLVVVAGWLVPGLGHVLLGRRLRGLTFFALIVATLVIGVALDGNLPFALSGQPLAILATLGAMGVGTPYALLQWVLGYAGSVEAAGYEYGTAFILTAGLMNLLLVLDGWDVARGAKSF